MLGIIKKMFIVLLSSIVNASNHAKCVSFSNQNLEFNLESRISLLSICG